MSAVATLALHATTAFAGHPMLSEDTGTQGAGNAELELGYAWSRQHNDRSFLFQPQLSYGNSSTFDLIVQPSWLLNQHTAAHTAGWGDTNLDVKWRFFGAAPWSLGVRAGLELPTAEHELGLPHDRFASHTTLVVTADLAPFIIDANLGYARMPAGDGRRVDLYHFSVATMFAANERWFMVLDTAIDSNPDVTLTTAPAVALLGVIYTARPGLDLDIGYRAGLTTTATKTQWLLGITYRGAL